MSELPKKNKVGRPIKWTLAAIQAEGEALLEWFNADEIRFWLKDFAIERGYSAQRFSDWSEVSEAFAESYKRAQTIQESRLVRGALAGKLNASVAVFVLKNIAGWRDRTEVAQTTRQEITYQELQPAERNERIGKLLQLAQKTGC